MKTLRLIVVLAMLAPSAVYADHKGGVSDSVKVLFRLGYRHYDPGFGDNAARMDAFMRSLHRADSMNNIDHIVIRSSASPDGTNSANEHLTVNRCRSLAEYISRRGRIDASAIHSAPGGIGWDELRRMVMERNDVPCREEVVRIIDETPVLITDGGGKVVGGRKKALMDLAGGTPYRWMYDNLFAELRSGLGISLYVNDLEADRAEVARLAGLASGSDRKDVSSNNVTENQLITPPHSHDAEGQNTDINGEASLTEGADSSQEGETGPTDVQSADTGGKESSSSSDSDGDATAAGEPLHRFALKTNLLYYAILMPSVEAEWRINRDWSVNIEADVAWWSKKSRHKYYQLAVVSPEVRRWFKVRKPWHGMYAGAFLGYTWYDLENGRRGHRGEGGAVGLSWGYMWPISRCWSLEAGIGVGYLYTRYKEYRPFDGHYLYERTKSSHYVGPLKAKLAIVWRFDDLNRKGGRK